MGDCIVGVAISGGELSDRLGRKNPLILAALLFLLSALELLHAAFAAGYHRQARIMGGIGIEAGK